MHIINADLDATHELIIAIKQSNLQILEEVVQTVSDPSSEKYGQYLSREEVGKLTLNAVAIDAVKNYLRANEILDFHQTIYGEFIRASAPRRKWEELFNAKFMAHKHVSSGKIVYRSSSYTLDSSLIDHVFTVCNLVDLPFFKENSHNYLKPNDSSIQSLSTQPRGFITPSRLNSYYNVFSNPGVSSSSQTIYSTDGEYFSSSDLASFQRTFGITNHPVDKDASHRDNPYYCGYDPNYCAESNLDLQYILSVAKNIPTSIT